MCVYTNTIFILRFTDGSYVGQKGVVLGWGVMFPSGNQSPMLQKLAVEVLSNFQCSRLIDDHVGLGMLCAAAPSLQGTCFVSRFTKR